MNELQKQFEKETGKEWFVIPYTHGENAYASWEYQLWLEARVNPLGAVVGMQTADVEKKFRQLEDLIKEVFTSSVDPSYKYSEEFIRWLNNRPNKVEIEF